MNQKNKADTIHRLNHYRVLINKTRKNQQRKYRIIGIKKRGENIMEYTDGMEKIRGYLTKEQINAYEGLTESMDRLSLN